MNLPTDVITKLCAPSCREGLQRGLKRLKIQPENERDSWSSKSPCFKGKSHYFVDNWLAWLDSWRVRQLSPSPGRHRHTHKYGPAKPERVELWPGERGRAHVLLFHKSLGAAKSSAAPPAPAWALTTLCSLPELCSAQIHSLSKAFLAGSGSRCLNL